MNENEIEKIKKSYGKNAKDALEIIYRKKEKEKNDLSEIKEKDIENEEER